jgi:hypothetical protein
MSPLISVGTGRSRSKRGRSLRPAIALQAGAADAVADLAARGLAVAVLSGSRAAHYRDRLTARTVDDVVTPALLALIWKNTHSPGTRELLAHTRRAFTKPAPRDFAVNPRGQPLTIRTTDLEFPPKLLQFQRTCAARRIRCRDEASRRRGGSRSSAPAA